MKKVPYIVMLSVKYFDRVRDAERVEGCTYNSVEEFMDIGVQSPHPKMGAVEIMPVSSCVTKKNSMDSFVDKYNDQEFDNGSAWWATLIFIREK